MKTFKPVLWSRPLSNGLFQVKIRITENRMSKYVNTDICVKKGDWSITKGRIKNSHENAEHLNKLIDIYLSKYLGGTEKIKREKEKKPGTLGLLMEMRIQDFQSQSRMAAVRRYTTLLNHLKVVHLDKVLLGDLTMIHRQRLDGYFINEAKIENSTRHTYHKVIRTSLKYAEGMPEIFRLPPHNIYYNHRVSYRSKTKTTLKSNEVHRMFHALTFNDFDNQERHSLQLFIFSFATMGMRFRDVMMLKWENIKDGYIDYTMSKNQRAMRVKLNENIINVLKFYLPHDLYIPKDLKNQFSSSPNFKSYSFKNPLAKRINNLENQYYDLKIKQTFIAAINVAISNNRITEEPENIVQILNKRDNLLFQLIIEYAKKNKGYIFTNVFQEAKSNDVIYNKTASQNAIINKKLKEVAIKLGIQEFSFHSARHTFAYLSRKEKTDIYLISRCLGHSSLSITEQYLREFEDSEVYEANDQMVKLIKSMYETKSIFI